MYKYFTSENVMMGHPDRVADTISDAFVEWYYKQDPKAHVAVETMIGDNFVHVAGEVSCKLPENTTVPYQTIIKSTLYRLGYNNDRNFNPETCEILVNIHQQSPQINQGVSKEETGAGDIGIMVGGAVKESSNYMPYAQALATDLADAYNVLLQSNKQPHLHPDAKVQVTIGYPDEDLKLAKPYIAAIIFNSCHDRILTPDKHAEIITNLVNSVLNKPSWSDKFDSNKSLNLLINTAGDWTSEYGGPKADVGLTGRKLTANSYGGYFAHGGGAQSGKDATKVDRSAFYMTRYIAKNLVASGICTKCEVQLSYSIGQANPVSLYVNTYGTGVYPDAFISYMVPSIFNLSVDGIIETFDLPKVSFTYYSMYSPFINGAPWEKLDKVDKIRDKTKEYPEFKRNNF